MIKQDESGKWWLHFSDGRKEGPFPSHARVMAREKQVNYFKYRNQHESVLNEGLKSWAAGKVTKAGKEVGDIAGKEIRKKMHQTATEVAQAYTPAIKRGAKKFMFGVGGVSLVGAGAGSYSGTRLANRKKKKIKESDAMLFPFAAGMNSILAKNRGDEANCLIQEGWANELKRALWPDKKLVAIARIRAAKAAKQAGSVLPASKLGKAMYRNPKAMDQAFRLYGPNSKTINKAIPNAFGKVK